MHTHHISLLAKDAKRNIAFYTKTLGMRLVKNSVNQENIKMRHLYYSDYLGTPGTVVTFFVLPLLGPRTDGNHFIGGIHLGIPQGASQFWMTRLAADGFTPKLDGTDIHVLDPDGVTVTLSESQFQLVDEEIVLENGIPAKYQVSRLLGTSITAYNVPAEINFFHDLLGLETVDNVLQLDGQEQIPIIKNDNEDKSRFGRGSVDHIALNIGSLAKLNEAWNKAKAMKLNIEMYKDRGWFKSLYIRDPNDNRIELATPTPGFSLDEPILTMGSQLGLPPDFEYQRQTIMNYFKDQDVDFQDLDD